MELKDIIIETCQDAPKYGNLEESVLAHAEEYGINDIDLLFPAPENLTKEPLFISRRMEWVNYFMSRISTRPFGRTKTIYADITGDDARALAYTKGNKKKDEIIALLKRITEPVTIYKKQALDMDNIIDITDMDVISWLREEMRVMLEEEIARACLLGDGRPEYSEDHISTKNIRPIFSEDELYVIKKEYPFEDLSLSLKYNQSYLLQFIDDSIRQHAYYEGSGDLTMFINRTLLVKLLLLTDEIGRRIYPTIESLAEGLMVNTIIPVDLFDNIIEDGGKTFKPLAITLDLKDYILGFDKNGQIATYDKFDIDYNKQKFLIETRCSGSLYRPHSAMVICMEQQKPEAIDVEVTKLPDKVIYKIGEQLDPSGLIISEIYSDGTKKKITNYELSSLDSTTEGEKTIYVTTDKFKTSFIVTVQIEQPTYIKITKNPDKMTYDIGEKFDKTGMIVVAGTSSGPEYPITVYNVSGFDSETEGEKTVTISYQKLSTTLIVTVQRKVANKIEVTKNPDKMTYDIGEKFDKTGMIVTAYYTDGSTRDVDDYTVSGFDSSTVGDKNLLITYRDLSTHLVVTVQDGAPISIKVTKLPDKTVYMLGENFDKTGLEVTAYYRSGASIQISGYTISGFDSSKAGTKHITVSYEGLSDMFDVVVKEKGPLKEIHVLRNPNGMYYESGNTMTIDGIIVEGIDIDGNRWILKNQKDYEIKPRIAPEVTDNLTEVNITVSSTNSEATTTYPVIVSPAGYSNYVYIHDFYEFTDFILNATGDQIGICLNAGYQSIKNPNPGETINLMFDNSDNAEHIIIDMRNQTLDLNGGHFLFEFDADLADKKRYIALMNGTIINGCGNLGRRVPESSKSLFNAGAAIFESTYVQGQNFSYNMINMNIKECIGAGCPLINGLNSVIYFNVLSHFTIPHKMPARVTFEHNSTTNSSLLNTIRFVSEGDVIFRNNLICHMGVTPVNPIYYHGLVFIGYNDNDRLYSFISGSFTLENNKILDMNYHDVNTMFIWDASLSASYVEKKVYASVSDKFETNIPIGLVLDGARATVGFTPVLYALGDGELNGRFVSGLESKYTLTKETVGEMQFYGFR